MTTHEKDASAPAATGPQAGNVPGHTVILGREEKLQLACGQELGPITVSYQTYGTLNADKSNAILVCHALTGDQFAAEAHPITGRPGWWERVIGPGL